MREKNMRTVPARLALLALAAAAAPALAQKVDLGTPEGANLAMRKIQCSVDDNVPVTYYWHGETFSRVPGEPDRKLFRVEGVNVRACVTVQDPQRGTGWRMVSRELLLYLDPQTGEVLRTWKNPWTGKEVNVLHIANDPVNQPAQFAVGRDGQPRTWPGTVLGNQWWMTSTIPLFYENPLGGAYQPYVGGTYHATEMFNFFGDVNDLTDPRRRTAQSRIGWARMSGWLPWMEMGDRVGILYFHTAGRKVDRFEDISPALLREIEQNFPEYRNPPPADDARPNETSWTYFKKKVPPAQGGGRAH
jgi:hypothetical protein